MKIFFLLTLLAVSCRLPLFAGETAIDRLRLENRKLRHELDRLRQELTTRDREIMQFRRWAAGVTDTGKLTTVSQREIRQAEILTEMIKHSSRLAVEASDITRTFRKLIKEFPIGPARQAHLLLQMEDLERAAMRVVSITGAAENEKDPSAFRNVRIVAVNRELETAVLSAGAVHGVFPGLIYQCERNPSLRLRVISVRPWVSAAVPVSGTADPLTPGMPFTALSQQEKRAN